MARIGHEDKMFYLGHVKAPTAILTYGEIPEYLTEEFWSQYIIWNKSRLTKSLPLYPVWADNPDVLVDIITAFENEYERIMM